QMLSDEIVDGIVDGRFYAPIPDHRVVHLLPDRRQVEGIFADQQRCEVVAQDRNNPRLRFHARPFETGIGFDFAESMHAVCRMHFDDHMVEPAESSTASTKACFTGKCKGMISSRVIFILASSPK